MTPLGLLAVGEAGVVCAGTAPRRAEELGLRAGSGVEVLCGWGAGPLVVRVRDARIALDRGLAMRIFVRREP